MNAMNLASIDIVFYSTAAVMLFVWLGAGFFVRYAVAKIRGEYDLPESPLDLDRDEGPRTSTVRGEVSVDRPPDLLLPFAAAQLAEGRLGVPVRIRENSRNSLVFELNAATGNRQNCPVTVQVDADHGKTLRYRVTGPRPRGLLLAARIVHVLGGLAFFAGFFAIQHWLLRHPHPAIRWQSVQIVQAIHFLWPPFLLAGIALALHNSLRKFAYQLEGFLDNLQYLSKSA